MTLKRGEELQAASGGTQFLGEGHMGDALVSVPARLSVWNALEVGGVRQQIDFWHEKRATYVVACRFKVRVRN